MEKWMYALVGTIISWSLGYFGADRFYKGQVALGILKLLTFGGFMVWWLVDAIIWTYKLGQVLSEKTKA
jgi:TM2 domain-containing membrane protein YozV